MPRLVDALERLAEADSQLGPFEIQHGSSALPRRWIGRPAYPPLEMEERLKRADIVICHGGPATIATARAAGKIPIVVPRLERFGEHVDNHQLWYAQRLSQLGEVVLADTVDSLSNLVNEYPVLVRDLPRPVAHDPAPAIARFTEVAEALIREARDERVTRRLADRSPHGERSGK